MEQNSVMVPLGAWHGDTNSDGYYLVSSLLDRRSLNFEALKNTLISSFNTIKGLEIRLIENGWILFKFAHILDRKRIVDVGPWAFEKNLLVLKVLENDDDPISTHLDWANFSVHVHGLPIGRMSRNMANSLGTSSDDLEMLNRTWGSVMGFLASDRSRP
ncbi:hypothetical protein Salat_1610500 [Sesamum alatum]|uniref:DUF4283 domain-containing protein n=1 Tax=Sesamum alatum TaxID=300844 RepID=A0AAE1Y6M0_9LAMI|nr:hypothetical protein Salat_1610500 [Sesamum alatum]